MYKAISTVVPPEVAFTTEALHQHLIQAAGLPPEALPQSHIRLEKRSIDARSRQIKVNIKASIWHQQEPSPLLNLALPYPNVSSRPAAVIVGAGPAGMFAALRLIELGIKPIIIERGKDVRARRRDLAAINKAHVVHPDSNYCFGEGGAGTYSDGKLYTRSKKRGDIRRVLEILVAHGAQENILADAHPHIGTNKLPKIVAALRQSILEAGGQVMFESKVTQLLIEGGQCRGVVLQNGQSIEGLGVILATGHSARDIYEMLHQQGVTIEAKPFALGVRIEHPQALIDRIQYKRNERGPYLPAAAYSLVHQATHKGQQRGVFSFCMCPGGFIVPAATAPGELVVNGMSPSRRNSAYANSGMVVSIEPQDWQAYAHEGPLAALRFQQQVEQAAYQAVKQTGHGAQTAPAQVMTDFVKGKESTQLLPTSYQPGLVATNMHQILPQGVAQRLRIGLKAFGQKMPGYLTAKAQLVGIESRTSAPVRIPRHKESLEHVQVARLFPCGEGAGFAGGIMSAAMDGERCAEKLAELYAQT